MKYLKNTLSDSKKVRKLAIGLLIVAFFVIAFLSVKLLATYKGKTNKTQVSLIYEFGPHTVPLYFDESVKDDIKEQFLSYDVSYGIDVSEWQGGINWEKVRATGISFVMIRCGFRQTVGGKILEDGMFKANIEGATKAGLRVGVYFFGAARTQEEAIEEAEFTVNLIKNYDLSYPVVYDIESFNEGRLAGISYSNITDNILSFTETVGSYGYETMVYTYHNALSYLLDTGKLEGKLVWLAHWVDKTDYKGTYHMWQYTSEGKVDGVTGHVDLNVSYFNYVDDEGDIVANPNYTPVFKEAMIEIDDKVKTKRIAVMRSSPTDELPNRLGSIPANVSLVRKEVGEEYSLIEYNGRSAYVANVDVTSE